MEALKGLINWTTAPEIFLPLFAVIFFLALRNRGVWTNRVGLPVLLLSIVFFVASFQDPDFRIIVTKGDNIPIVMLLFFVGFFVWFSMKQACENDDRISRGEEPREKQEFSQKVLTWPHLVYTELICLTLASVALILWSILIEAPLEEPANPAKTPNPSKAPWYFLGLQEMLVYFDPWMAGVILPTMILTGLIAMPYIDTNPKGNGYFTLRERKFAITVWLFGFLILWVVLIVFGTFLRGPNWNFFGPYQYWDAHMQVPLTNINLSQFFWVFGLKQPEPTNPLVREWLGIVLIAGWIFVLPVLLARTVMRRLYEQMGPGRFYLMAIHLVVMGLLPVKMVTRWVFTLKYFIYLPEFNLNL